MGNCDGRSSFEYLIDEFFEEMTLTHLNNYEVETLVSNNIFNNQFCGNKLENFNLNILEFLKSFSETEKIREKTILFWQNSFEIYSDQKNQFLFICCMCFLCKFDKNTFHKTLLNIGKLYNNLNYTNNDYIVLKKDLIEMVDFYMYFITIHTLKYLKESVNEKEKLWNNMSVVYRDNVRNYFSKELFMKYEEKIDLEIFIQNEINNLFHINLRIKLKEIHLKSD